MSQSDISQSQFQQPKPPKKVCLSCTREYSIDMVVCPDDDTLLTPILADTLIGTVLADRYEIQEKLGTGGMGNVYKAKHLLMKRLVAIKLILPQYASNATAVKRFQHEAQAASHLDHPNILTVYDFGVSPEGLPYLVMDLLHGTNLSAVIESEGYLRPERAINIFQQTCSALYHAHSKNVVHRDLKPGNIMLVEYEGTKDWVQIVDFGMAKILSGMDGEREELTKVGEVFGSPMYMSPEQCMAKELDARSDIYSLGCVMYRALTGKPAVAGQTAMECFNKHANGEPEPFASACPELNLSANLEAIVFKAMAKEPDNRFQSMLELRDALMGEVRAMGDMSISLPSGIVQIGAGTGHRSEHEMTTAILTDVAKAAQAAVKPTLVPTYPVQTAAAKTPVPAAPPATAAPATAAPAAPTLAATIPDIKNASGPKEHKSQSNAGTAAGESSTDFAEETIIPVHAPSALEQKQPKATPKGIIYACLAGAVIIIVAAVVTFGSGASKNPAGTGSNSGTGNTSASTAGGGKANDASTDFKLLMRQGHAAFDHGDYPEALNKFNAAFNKARADSDYDQGVPEARLWLGRTYFETEDFDKAKEHFQELIKVRENSHQLSAMDATEAMNFLGNIYVARKDYPQAKKWFDQSLRLRKAYKGDDYCQVAETLAGMGNLEIEQGQFNQAISVLQEAEKIGNSSSTFQELDKAKIFNALGQAYQFEGKRDRAGQYYEKALNIRQRNLNPESPAIADTLVLMGTLEFSKHNLGLSEKLLKQALDIQQKALGADSPRVATTKFCLGVLYHKQGKGAQAKALVQDALRIRQQQLGSNDPDTLQTKKFLQSL